jgi:hypothetical protein
MDPFSSRFNNNVFYLFTYLFIYLQTTLYATEKMQWLNDTIKFIKLLISLLVLIDFVDIYIADMSTAPVPQF